MGFLVKLDTNGSNSEMLDKLIKEGLLDYVAMDVKAPRDKYAKTVGIEVDLKSIEKSVSILRQGESRLMSLERLLFLGFIRKKTF